MPVLSPTRAVKALLPGGAVILCGVSQAQQVVRVTANRDQSPSELARKAAPLVNKTIDRAWFGGFSFVQAVVRSGGRMPRLVQREEDPQCRSVFITADLL